ncbi:Uma2 family endonuclease [Lentibacillus cibarius]|uniref:Uma2 family endonuclease n=1 Tax=Lentibacillus cibarius TaxID=2583219 RepID=A0A5S3QK48_9BACI|nr:Uma2 family endonuclease [Lentibacillus cibarius]TMN22119.1 Uma2 family endonuclease [Lentibacillus cibarius]
MAIPDEHKRYSYADYLTWDDAERMEIIGGEVVDMSPAPSRKHQQILRDLSTAFANFLRDKTCEVFFAPFDVRLAEENKRDDEINNVVQPDLTVVCDETKLDNSGCNGVPDMIAEITSPSSVKQDRWTKYKLYEKTGVKEYWLVDPENQSVEVHILTGEQYQFQGVFTKEDTIAVHVLPGLALDLSQLFM